MKTGIVTPEQIAKSGDLQLGAKYYLDPTADIDKEIARTERTIELAQARLIRLRAAREELLKRKARE